MSRINGVRKALLAGFVALTLTSTAFAQTSTPATGLGQSWPNAADLSKSPNWHVYVFVLNGIKYIQINDLNGTVHAAIAVVDGAAAVLPMGIDSQNVQTTTSNTASTASSTAQTIYSDATTKVTATPRSSGATTFAATTQTCDALNCSAVDSAVP